MQNIHSEGQTIDDSQQRPGKEKQSASAEKEHRESGTIQKLISRLPLHEQSKYSNNIASYLNIDLIYPQLDTGEGAGGMLQRSDQELKKLGFWMKMKIFFLATFHEIPNSTLYIEVQLVKIARKANKKRKMVSIRQSGLTRGFLFALAELYKTLQPLLEVYKQHWKTTDSVREVLVAYLQHVMPSEAYALYTHISEHKIKEMLHKGESREKIFSLLQERVVEYMNKLPDELLRSIESVLFPFYAYRYVSLFDFHKIFAVFGVENDKSMLLPHNPVGNFLQCRTLLFQLFFALTEIYRFPIDMQPSSKLLMILAGGSKEKAEDIRVSMNASRKLAEGLFPMEQIQYMLKCAYHDPYLDPTFSHGLWNLRPFIGADIVLRSWYQFTSDAWHFKQQNYTRNIKQLFPKGLDSFHHLIAYPCPIAQQLFLPAVQHVMSFQIIVSFISELFIKRMLPWFSSVPVRSNTNLNNVADNLVRIKNDFEILYKDIYLFDASFATSASIGKVFEDICQTLNTDKHSEQVQQSYRKQVINANNTAKQLLARAKRSMKSLSGIFQQLFDNMNKGKSIVREQKTSGFAPKDLLLDRCDDYLATIQSLIELIEEE